MSTALSDLDAELAAWAEAAATPRLWLRDDDATRPTDALDQLIALSATYMLPVLLAVIPEPATADLAKHLAGEPLLTPAVHGFRHANHAPAGAKSTELTENGAGRTVDAVLAELEAGRAKLATLFGDRLSTILVPPWNRVSPAVTARLADTAFGAVSLFGWTEAPCPLPRLDTHVDLIDWRGGRVGIDFDAACAALIASLQRARLSDRRPVGILTHHLAHDEAAWRTLEALADALTRRGLRFDHAANCLGASPQP